MKVTRCRIFSTRVYAILLLAVGFGAYCYYYSTNPTFVKTARNINIPNGRNVEMTAPYLQEPIRHKKIHEEQCPVVKESKADIDTMKIFPQFDFQPSWLRTKEFWDKKFEDRYEMLHMDNKRPELKVIVVPHSHNDPGWLKTYEQYFESKTKNIINNIVAKLNQYPNMTFIWTEISYLSAWWERSHPTKQKALKKLIKEGRLEITSGGWVMPDEACTHIYALVDQFIEGHNWVKSNLGVSPKTGWSIDPFGHGPTVPYLLDKSGLEGAIIQRIHYAWKQWFANKQIEEFHWLAGWGGDKPSLVMHNQPFDIYSIKSTCGPHPAICLSFDFRKIPGEYSEYTSKQEDITERNLHSKAMTLMEEYERIGSLTFHNVVLVPLGDDFRYEYGIEFDAQYTNYMKLFNYINSRKDVFNADVRFGTPLDYFKAMRERNRNIPTLRGDFFVYSDIFSEGKPAYWSGYYTTRPYLKILARQFEHQLRTSEILFTFVSNYVKQTNALNLDISDKRLEKWYEQLVNARRNLGLFQHHDAITGTSKANVMYDYGTKLFTSLYHCIRLQEVALTMLMIPDPTLHSQNIIQSEVEWETYGKPARKLMVSTVDKRNVVLFNPLAEPRTEVITIVANTTNIRVYDTRKGEYVPYQIMPNIEVREDGKRMISESSFDVLFVATLPALTMVTFKLEEHFNASHHCKVFCNNCSDHKTEAEKNFTTKKLMPGDIQLENTFLKLLISRNSGFLRQIYRKDIMRKSVVEMQFGAYQSAQRHSGAYLFMPDYDSPEKSVLDSSEFQDDNIIIVSGPVSTEITTMYLPLLVHTIRIYNIDDPVLSRAVLIENNVDFEDPPKNRDTELFMRIQTDIQNGDVPEFYTDQNGFQYQRRVKVDKLGIEANYYPITTMAWLQDNETRLTLVTNHAQGAASYEPGRLELMLDRRTLYDDLRGIGEGVVDNRPAALRHWLLLEGLRADAGDAHYQLPSRAAEYMSRAFNYPVNTFLVDTSEVGEVTVASHHTLVENFPQDIHLVTLRTITDELMEQFPTKSCYMVVHRPGRSCAIGANATTSSEFTASTAFAGLRVANITAVSLTGLRTLKHLNGLADIHVDPMELKTYKIKF